MPQAITVKRSELEALGAKLDALDLTDVEHALLEAVLDAAAGSEVSGYFGFVEHERVPVEWIVLDVERARPPSTGLMAAFVPNGKLAVERGFIVHD